MKRNLGFNKLFQWKLINILMHSVTPPNIITNTLFIFCYYLISQWKMKIYIPMKENYEHWHLIVINNEEQKIYQLDSH